MNIEAQGRPSLKDRLFSRKKISVRKPLLLAGPGARPLTKDYQKGT